MSVAKEARINTVFQRPRFDEQVQRAAHDHANGALDAAWDYALMEPLPSTPTSAEHQSRKQVLQSHGSSDVSCNQPTFDLQVTALLEAQSEGSEGWESEDECESVLSSIASFDLDKALEELELDQQESFKAGGACSAKSKTSTVYFSPAGNFDASPGPDNTLSPSMAHPQGTAWQ
jgi:hypothetical protein